MTIRHVSSLVCVVACFVPTLARADEKIDHERLTHRHASREFRLTDVYGHVVREILA